MPKCKLIYFYKVYITPISFFLPRWSIINLMHQQKSTVEVTESKLYLRAILVPQTTAHCNIYLDSLAA